MGSPSRLWAFHPRSLFTVSQGRTMGSLQSLVRRVAENQLFSIVFLAPRWVLLRGFHSTLGQICWHLAQECVTNFFPVIYLYRLSTSLGFSASQRQPRAENSLTLFTVRGDGRIQRATANYQGGLGVKIKHNRSVHGRHRLRGERSVPATRASFIRVTRHGPLLTVAST